MKFKENLKEYRQEKGLTQRELAIACGLSQSNISAWEKGERLPLPDGLIKLACFFRCSVDQLLGIEDIIQKEDEIIDYGILKKYSKLSLKDKLKTEGYIDCLLDKNK